MTKPQHVGRKLFAALFAASLTVLAAPAAGAQAAAPQARNLPAGNIFQLRNENTGDCMEPKQDDRTDYLGTDYCDRQAGQAWTSHAGEIRNLESDKCIQDFGNGDAVATYCDEGLAQQWDFNNGWIHNRATGACLADGGGYVYTTNCSDHSDEQWLAEQP